MIGSFDIVVHYETESGVASVSQPLTVTHPRLVQAMAECEACNGDWGPHGMTGHIGCLCRTPDGGTPCDDGRDCEAMCVSTGNGFACSEFTTTFGCHSYLPDGWSLAPKTSVGRRAPSRCVD